MANFSLSQINSISLIFTFIYTSDNSIFLNVLHVFYITVRVIVLELTELLEI